MNTRQSFKGENPHLKVSHTFLFLDGFVRCTAKLMFVRTSVRVICGVCVCGFSCDSPLYANNNGCTAWSLHTTHTAHTQSGVHMRLISIGFRFESTLRCPPTSPHLVVAIVGVCIRKYVYMCTIVCDAPLNISHTELFNSFISTVPIDVSPNIYNNLMI